MTVTASASTVKTVQKSFFLLKVRSSDHFQRGAQGSIPDLSAIGQRGVPDDQFASAVTINHNPVTPTQ
jgi:hypothetical protein